MVLRIPKISVSTIFVIIPILYFNSCTFEFIKHYSFVLPIVIACVLLWCATLLKEDSAINLRYTIPMIGFVLILGVLFLVGGQNRVSVLQTDLMNTMYLLFFMLVFVAYSAEHRKNDRVFIIFIYFIDVIISCIYSVFRLIDDPNLSRLLSTGSYHSTSAAKEARGIISFGVVYGLVLVLLVLFWFIVKQKRNRLLNIGLSVLFIIALFLAQFLIAILLVGIGVVWFLFVNTFKNDKNNRIRLLVIVVIAVIGIILLPFLLEIMIDSDIFGYEINARLQEMLMMLRGEMLEGTDISARFLQYFTSVSAFVLSYGLGKIAITSVSVGSHSQWLDGFGNYGLLFVLYIVAFFAFRKFVLQSLPNERAKQIYKLVFGIYVVMSLINTSTWAPITLSLFVIVPFLCLDKVEE